MKNAISVCLSFKKFALLAIFLGFFFGFNAIVYGQYDTYFLTVDPYASNGYISYFDTARVHKVSDFIGVTSNPPPVLATFTGGRTGGNYFQSCLGMIGYMTSRKDRDGRTNLPNKINIAFHKPVKFDSIRIEGKYPQRMVVSLDGKTIEVDFREEYPLGSGYGSKVVSVNDFFGDYVPRRFSNITITTADPNWRFGIYAIYYNDLTPRNGGLPPPPDYCNMNQIARPAPQNHSEYGWTMRSEVSDLDGLVLSDVRLNGRLMAEKISVPYYQITTNQTSSQRGELRPNDTGGTLRSRLVTYRAEMDDERLIVTATYAIDNISSAQSCLSITQRYEFLKAESGSVRANASKFGI